MDWNPTRRKLAEVPSRAAQVNGLATPDSGKPDGLVDQTQ
jgi:hypothetical protein